jgi:phosphotransferase system  glucose/maltose/N-acetylglucosamine-specific IIC component
MIEWFYRAYKEKNKNILNIFSGLFLVCSSISWMVYGYQFEELSFLIPNVIGLVIAGIYIRIWFYLRKFENLESPQKDNDMENNINNENKDNLSNSNKTFDEQEKMVKNN